MNRDGKTSDIHANDYSENLDGDDSPRLIEVAQEYQRELEAGRVPNRQQLIDRYPDLTKAINQCLDGLDLLHRGMPRLSASKIETDVSRAGQKTGEQPLNALGDFQIVREIAHGGMGVVYEAIQLSLGRRVALKVLPFAATLDARQLQRFKNEAQAAALLHHTHLVPIYAVGCERGVHFYAMQLIDGQSLATVIEQLRKKDRRPSNAAPDSGNQTNLSGGSPTQPWHDSKEAAQEKQKTDNSAPALPTTTPEISAQSTVDISTVVTAGSSITSEVYVRRVAQLMVQAATALEHAHQIGVVHRDMKPANLLVDAQGNLWVTDFGLAQLQTEPGLTRSGDFLGTFRYMSPEQISGQRSIIDHRTDIYSLGATFFELLTLEPVFPGETHQELLYQVLHQEPRSPRSLNRAITPELEIIVLKAVSKVAHERYTSAAEFAADIERYLKHEPIRARRPSRLDRARKWSRRHPSIVIAGILLLIVVAVGSLISNRLISEEQNRTAAALEGEKLHAQEAERRFLQARSAVDSLFQISEEELAGKPETRLRRRILELVLYYYQDFIDGQSGDPSAQAKLAVVQEQVKGILHQLEVIQKDMNTTLLAQRPVQEELQLTAKQIAQLQPLWTQPTGPRKGNSTPQSEEKIRTRMAADAEQRDRAIAEMLTPTQLARFKQICLQRLGLAAFKEPEIIKALNLSDEQRTKIREIEREAFAMRFPPHGPGKGPGKGLDDRPDDRHHGPDGPGHGPPPPDDFFGVDQQELIAKVLKVLTQDQAQQWNELIGKPFLGFDDEPFHGPGHDGPFGGF